MGTDDFNKLLLSKMDDMADRQIEQGRKLDKINDTIHGDGDEPGLKGRVRSLEDKESNRAAREEKRDANWAKVKLAAATTAVTGAVGGIGTLIVKALTFKQ